MCPEVSIDVKFYSTLQCFPLNPISVSASLVSSWTWQRGSGSLFYCSSVLTNIREVSVLVVSSGILLPFSPFTGLIKSTLKDSTPPKAFLKLRIPTCTSELRGPRDSKGHNMDFMICPLIWTCCNQQMDSLFFKGRVEIHKKFRCDIAV